MGRGCAVLAAVAVIAVVAANPPSDCTLVGDAQRVEVGDTGGGRVVNTFCIDVGTDDVGMLVVLEATHGDVQTFIMVNDSPTCSECHECVSLQDAACLPPLHCSCTMHCSRGVCAHTAAPLHPGRWYVMVDGPTGYSLRLRLTSSYELVDGHTHESSLASVQPYLLQSPIREASPWWDFYTFTADEDLSLFVVTAKNLQDSGPRRGYVKVLMRRNAYPDLNNNDAQYNTYSRDTVEGKLRDVKKGEVVYVGVVGMGGEDWIRYSIKTGGHKFAVVYAVLGVVSLLVLLGAFVWYYKKRVTFERQRQRMFASAVNDDDAF